MRLAFLLAALGGCHIVAGFDGLELREDADVRWSQRFGDVDKDELASQFIEQVAVVPRGIRALGSYEGEFKIGETTLSGDGVSFLTHFNHNGEPEWTMTLPTELTPLALVPNSTRVVVKYAEPFTFAGVDLPGTDAFAILDVNGPGSASLIVNGTGAVSAGGAALVPVPGQDVLIFGGTVEGVVALDGCPETDPTMSSLEDIVVARIDGQCNWLRPYGDTQSQQLDDIGADNGGNVVFGGRFQGRLDLDDNTVLESTGGTDLFVAKLDPEGEALWARSFGAADYEQSPIRLAVRDSGTISMAAFFDGPIDLGPPVGVLTATQGSDIVVAKLSPNGDTVWARQIAVRNDLFFADAEDEGRKLSTLSIAVDSAGYTIVAGHFRGDVDFGGTTRSSEGEVDMFLFKLDVEGELLWSGSFGDAGLQCEFIDCYTSLAVDATDSIVLGGGFYGSMNLGNNDLESAGELDAFLAKFAP